MAPELFPCRRLRHLVNRCEVVLEISVQDMRVELRALTDEERTPTEQVPARPHLLNSKMLGRMRRNLYSLPSMSSLRQCKRWRLLLVLLVTATCPSCVTSVRSLAAPESLATSIAPLGLSLVVAPHPDLQPAELRERAVAAALRDFDRTDLFSSVEATDNPEDATADLIAYVRSASGSHGCGNPLIGTWLTLGLLSTRAPYQQTWDFELVGPATSQTVSFTEVPHQGQSTYGLLALPMRLSSRWSRVPSVGAPATLIPELQAWLLSRRQEITAIAKGDS